ncbi:MAG TPA: hypothetical protein VMU61_08360 [Candidatus Aquilonibacter sp.]|nr:hypothetical protein [Candidatus Aquilonibacter sp.]
MNLIRYPVFVAVLLPALISPPQPQTQAPERGHYTREASITETAGAIHIAANSPRPLEQVLEALQQKYGWLVDYEDPRYLSKHEIVERPGMNGTTYALPDGGVFNADVPAGKTAPPPEDKTLEAIVDAYNQGQNPGRFALRQNEDGSFAVVGIGAEDDAGKISIEAPALDQQLTLPETQRTATETAHLICENLSRETHVQFTLGITPRLLMDHKEVKVGGNKMQARTLLARTLQATGHTMYYRLLFDPSSKSYFLDIHAVRGK